MLCHHTDVVSNVNMRVALLVAHAVAAAEIEHVERFSGFPAYLRHKGDHDIRRVQKRLGIKALRTDMAVNARQIDVIQGQNEANQLQSLSGLDRGAEFGIYLAGCDGGMRMRIDAGGHAQDDILCDTACRGRSLNFFQLLAVVRDKAADFAVQCKGDIRIGFVVTVKVCTA